jgi:hypothetical protein
MARIGQALPLHHRAAAEANDTADGLFRAHSAGLFSCSSYALRRVQASPSDHSITNDFELQTMLCAPRVLATAHEDSQSSSVRL